VRRSPIWLTGAWRDFVILQERAVRRCESSPTGVPITWRVRFYRHAGGLPLPEASRRTATVVRAFQLPLRGPFSVAPLSRQGRGQSPGRGGRVPSRVAAARNKSLRSPDFADMISRKLSFMVLRQVFWRHRSKSGADQSRLGQDPASM
jgi:hypothetical protein